MSRHVDTCPFCGGPDYVPHEPIECARTTLAARDAEIAALEAKVAELVAEMGTDDHEAAMGAVLLNKLALRGLRQLLDAERAAHAETRRELELQERRHEMVTGVLRAEVERTGWQVECMAKREGTIRAERDTALRERDERRTQLADACEHMELLHAANERLVAERDAAQARVRTLLAEHEQASQIIQGWEANAAALAEALWEIEAHDACPDEDPGVCLSHVRAQARQVLAATDVSPLLAGGIPRDAAVRALCCAAEALAFAVEAPALAADEIVNDAAEGSRMLGHLLAVRDAERAVVGIAETISKMNWGCSAIMDELRDALARLALTTKGEQDG